MHTPKVGQVGPNRRAVARREGGDRNADAPPQDL
jgi:hypothetical protein